MTDLVMQYVHYLQRKYSLGSFNLLGHTAPVQAMSLLLLGPFLDYWLTSKRVDAYDYNMISLVSTENSSKFSEDKIHVHITLIIFLLSDIVIYLLFLYFLFLN